MKEKLFVLTLGLFLQTLSLHAETLKNPCFDAKKAHFYQCSFVFDSAPHDFSAKVEVAAVFVQVKDKILLLKRHPQVSKGNTWAIPAGKVESKKNETAYAAAIRELEEETGIKVTKLEVLKTVFIREPKGDYIYHMFGIQLKTIPEVHLAKEESVDFQWATRYEVGELNLQNSLILDEMPCIQRIFGNSDFSSRQFLFL